MTTLTSPTKATSAGLETKTQLSIASRTRIDGTGRESFQVKTAAGPQTYGLLLNANPVWPGGGTLIDRDITIERTGFVGHRGMPCGHDFIDFIGVDGLCVRDCLFADRDRDLLVLSNCNAPTIENSFFRNFGGPLPDNPGAGQSAGGMAIFCLTPSFDGRIVGCHFTDGGGGVWIPVSDPLRPDARIGAGWYVAGNFFRRLQEAAIVGGDYATITGNVIDDVARTDVSGHGMELHGTRLKVTDNDITNIDGSGVYAANVYHSTIRGNTIGNVGRKGSSGSIVLATFGAASGEGDVPPHHVTIADNELADGYILLANLTGDATKLMTDITIRSRAPVAFFPSKAEVVGRGFDCQAPELSQVPT